MSAATERRPARSVAGLDARRAAVDLVHGVIAEHAPLDALLAPGHGAPRFLVLTPQDRALAYAIAGATLRHLGTLRALLGRRMARGLPRKSGKLEAILLTGAAQLLFLAVPAHAAVDLAVRTARAEKDAQAFAPLVNAVLRGLSRDGLPADLAEDPALDTPAWLMRRWSQAWGAEAANGFAAAHRLEPALDLTVRADPEAWAEKLGAEVLPTGSLRLLAKGPVPALPGYEDGAWWVQDAAAALPARLLGDVAGQRVADLCAAPGGKTAQLAAAGAHVTAVDASAPRLERLAANLKRLKLSAEIVAADVRAFAAEPFDAVLLDAPCSSTGTIRRHPDVAWLKRESDLPGLVALQAELLDAAARLVKPGGKLVYSVCSLEPEEGERRIEALLAGNPGFRLDPIGPAEIGGVAALITDAGTLRALPTHLPNPEPRLAGLDGFCAARLVRT